MASSHFHTAHNSPPPSDEKTRFSYQIKSFMRLWPYLWPRAYPSYKFRTFLALILTICGQFVLVGAPFLLGHAQDLVDTAMKADSLGPKIWLGIFTFIIGYGALRFFSVFINEIREYIFSPVGQYAQRQVATATFAHIHSLSLRYHLERRTGALSRVIERGIRSIDFLFRFLLFNIGPTLLQLMIAGIAFWIAYDMSFTIVALIVVIAYIWFTVATTEWRLKFRRIMNEKNTQSHARAVDSLLNYETVKYFNAEAREIAAYDAAMAGYQEAAIRSRTSLATVNIGQALFMNGGLVVLMIMAAQKIVAGSMSVGDMTTIVLVMSQVYRPLNILGFAYREIKQSLTDMEKMFALLDLVPDVRDKPHAKVLNIGGGAVRFEHVDFHYEPDRPILKDVSFDIPAGTIVAVVGPTGAGKSTLSRIIFRFYDIASGRVSIDGQDMAELTQDSLRGAIGIVPQDTVLFNESLAYNIGYGTHEARHEDIIRVAKAAQIHDFIMGLPKAYDTQVGERGLKLSGGEKQRVAIARALLKDPKILILDEATSALDSVTEQNIQSALAQTTLTQTNAKRTTLVIAHRLSTIIEADQILVMDQGRIVERGRHEDLLSLDGLYTELWLQQQDGSE